MSNIYTTRTTDIRVLPYLLPFLIFAYNSIIKSKIMYTLNYMDIHYICSYLILPIKYHFYIVLSLIKYSIFNQWYYTHLKFI